MVKWRTGSEWHCKQKAHLCKDWATHTKKSSHTFAVTLFARLCHCLQHMKTWKIWTCSPKQTGYLLVSIYKIPSWNVGCSGTTIEDTCSCKSTEPDTTWLGSKLHNHIATPANNHFLFFSSLSQITSYEFSLLKDDQVQENLTAIYSGLSNQVEIPSLAFLRVHVCTCMHMMDKAQLFFKYVIMNIL